MAEDLNGQLEDIKRELNDLRHSIMDLIERVAKLEGKVSELTARNEVLIIIIKYVVTPLLIIVGGLVGIKLVMP